MDLQELSDDELDALRRDVLIEQERRAAIATIPGQVAQLAEKYAAGGGDPATLLYAIGDA